MPFFFIFILFPFLEILVFAETAAAVGLFGAILLILLAAFSGIILIRYQGLRTGLAMQETYDRGILPPHEVFDGFCRFAAGILLIIPGFITDAVALLLLLAPARRAIEAAIRRHPDWADPVQKTNPGPSNTSDIIEGEYERLDEDGRK